MLAGWWQLRGSTETYYTYAILSYVCARDFFPMFQTFPEMSIQDSVCNPKKDSGQSVRLKERNATTPYLRKNMTSPSPHSIILLVQEPFEVMLLIDLT